MIRHLREKERDRVRLASEPDKHIDLMTLSRSSKDITRTSYKLKQGQIQDNRSDTRGDLPLRMSE